MKLNPQQAPLYGACVLTVCLDEDEARWPEQEEKGGGGGGGGEAKVFYLLFSGSTQRHLTTTLQVNHVTLQAVCPAHDACEQVVVTLCSVRPDGQVDPQSQQHFFYVPDLALDMAHFLLSNGAPQGVMLLDDQQECERLDQSLALALRHLTWPRPRPAPGVRPERTGTDADATAAAETPAAEHADTRGEAHPDSVAVAARAETTMDAEILVDTTDPATDPEDHIDVSQWGGHRWAALLHFAASRGLRRVLLFLLRQPAAREALRQRDARGETPASLARAKGHLQLAAILTRCEASAEEEEEEEDLQENTEGHLQIYPEGRAFQCHPGLGTYTLTLPSNREKEREGGDRRRSESRLLTEEVEELQRLVHIHRELKGNRDFCDSSSPTPGSAHLYSGHGLCSPAGGAWPKSNGQSERLEPAEPAVEALETCRKATESQVGERGVTVAGIAACDTGSPRPIQEEKAVGRAGSAVGRHTPRSRKNRKRKNTGNDRSATRTPEKAINNSSAITTGSNAELNIVLPKELVAEGKSTEPERTPFPTVPLSGAVRDAGQVVVATSTAEQQEGGSAELGLETSASEAKRGDLTGRRTNEDHLPGETEAKCDPRSGGDTETKVSMGQGQGSQDSETDPREPTRPDSERAQGPGLAQGDGPKLSPSPGKSRRILWRDGGWTGGAGLAFDQCPEAVASTVWYEEDESPDAPPTEGTTLLSQRTEVHAQTADMVVNQTSASPQSENGHRGVWEQTESALCHPQALGVGGGGTREPLETDLCFQVSVSALSQAGDPGLQPAPSHVPGAQRQEASGKQRDEGGRGEGGEEAEERKERGAAGGARVGAGGDANDDRRRRADSAESLDRGPEEGAEQTATDKGRKKRRRKRARRGAVEAKLSSSSSTESHVPMDAEAEVRAEADAQPQSDSPTAETPVEVHPVQPDWERDIQAPSGGAADWGELPSTERAAGTHIGELAAPAGVAGRAGPRPPCPSESVLREEVGVGTMCLPSQTEDKSVDCSEPIVACTHTDSAPSLALIHSGSKEIDDFLHPEGPDSAELSSDVTVPMEWNISIQPVDFNTPAEDIESPASDLNIVNVNNVVPIELDYGHSDTTESNRAFDVAELSEQKAELVAAMEHDNSSHVEALEATPNSEEVDPQTEPQCVTTMETAIIPHPVAQLSESTTETGTFTGDARREGGTATELPQQAEEEEGPADVSPLKTREGSADATATAHVGHCFGLAVLPGDGPGEDKVSGVKGSETRGRNEEMREACVEEGRSDDELVVAASVNRCTTWIPETGEGEEAMESSGEVHDDGNENEHHGEAENRSDGGRDNPRDNEEIAAAAVAVVTVAIASALANIELSRRLADGLTEGQLSKEASLRERTCTRPSSEVGSEHKLPLDGEVKAVAEDQLTSDLQAELAAVLATSEKPASHDLSDTDEYCSLDDNTSADGGYQLKEVDEPQDNDSVSVPEAHLVDLERCPGAHIVNTEQLVSQTISLQNHCLDLDQDVTVDDGPAQADVTATMELIEVLSTQPSSPTGAPSEGQLCQDDRVLCPVVVDTGQGSGTQLDVLFDSSAAEDPRHDERPDDSAGELDRSLFEEPPCIDHNPEHGAGVPLATRFLSCEVGESQETSNDVAVADAASEAPPCVKGWEATVECMCEVGEWEIRQDGSAVGQRSPVESGECGGDPPHSESPSESSYAGAVARDDEVSNFSMPVGEATLPVIPGHSVPGNSPPDESTGPVTLGNGTARPSVDMFVLATPMEFQSSGFLQLEGDHGAVLCDGDGVFQDQGGNVGSVDTVDGWKDPERASDEGETRRITATAQECSTTETESLLEAKLPMMLSEGALCLEIQREKETFYPLQPCPEPCAALSASSTPPAPVVAELGLSGPGERGEEERHHPGATHDALERLTPTTELDDCVFKKPALPVSRSEFRERRVRSSWSSADDSSVHGPPSVSSLPSLDTASSGDTVSMDSTSVDTADSAPPWVPGGPRKSPEEGGGGCAGVEGGEATGVEEEEKKDCLADSPVTSAILRASNRSLSPFRRHSWEYGRSSGPAPPAEPGPAQRSSQRILPVEVRRPKPPLHRRSMSWCPSNRPRPDQEQIDTRSFSLEGLEVERTVGRAACPRTGAYDREDRPGAKGSLLEVQEREGGSLVSLTEEEQEGDAGSPVSQSSHRVLSMQTSSPTISHHQTLTKSISMVAISQRETDAHGRPRVKRRISFSLSISPLFPKTRSLFSIGSFSSDDEGEGGRVGSFSTTSGSLEYSICEEEPGPLRSNSDRGAGGVVVGGTKVSRTFSYLRSKMSKKNKGSGSDKEKRGEKDREGKEREKRPANGHAFSLAPPPPGAPCQHCPRPLLAKDTFLCTNCGVHVHKHCRENVSPCAKGKMKQQLLAPDAAPGSAVNLRSKSSSSTLSISTSSSSSLTRDRWSTLAAPEDQMALPFPRRNPSILSFSTHSNLAKSISTSNIAGLDDVPLKGLKFLSQSTDNLHQGSKVNASTESLTDEGTEMMDSQLMGEFECEVKELEADSWSATVDKKFLKLHKKDEVKRQDVIYELYQTELHHVRTLRIMSEVYYKGLQKELQLDTQTLDKVFPVLDDLLETHTHFLTLLLERRKTSLVEGRDHSIIHSIGDILTNQFSGCNAERMKKVYGKFCSRHIEAVNLYKELHAKDKRFQALIKRLMSSSIVRRLSIPECILLVTQRITKYPVLIQRILQHTRDTDEDHARVSESLRCVKEVIAAVDSKVNEQEKKTRLREVYSRTDSKSIMRMKSGQMFAKEDLIRGRRLLHDGALQLKNTAGRLKDVHAMLLSDVLVFLQEKDQKYVFASLDQRSTVISLQKLIVREVANEERGLFLITAGTEKPEMVEVLASCKEERNGWMSVIQDTMHCIEKEEDEGVPSESEEDRRQQENRAKEIRELLRRKDEQIVTLLEEKVHIFKDLCDCNPALDEGSTPVRERMLFRATPDDVTKGEPIMKDALKEVESLHTLVNSSVGGAAGSTAISLTGGSVGPVCLPRRAETFGGFDSHQMNSSKSGEKEEGDDALDLRRTESDSVLKKGANTSLQMLLKRNNEQVQHSVGHLHDLLSSLQAVVVQQDSFIEDQRQALSERLAAQPVSRHSSSSSTLSQASSSSSSRPSSLIEQEKQRSLERQRQEAASLQKQQAAHQEERRRREREWEGRERGLGEREVRLRAEEEAGAGARAALEDERRELQRRKDDYQRDLERLREAQRRLERDREALRRESERLEALRSSQEQSGALHKFQRTSSTTSEDSLRFHSSSSLDLEPRDAPEAAKEVELSSSAPAKEPFLRIGSKRMGKNFNPFSSSSSSSKTPAGDKDAAQLPNRLLQLAKAKGKKEKKKKGRGGEREETGQDTVTSEAQQNDGEIFFC